MEYFYSLNMEQAKRDEIIGTSFITDKSTGGTKNFLNLCVEQLRQLLKENFTRPELSHNASPTIGQMLDFALECLKADSTLSVSFDGYAVDSFHWDYDVNIDAIKIRGKITPEIKSIFLKFVDGSDEATFENDYLYAWWD